MQICAWIWFLHTSYSFSDFIWNICLIFCIMLSVILPSWVMLFPTCFGFRLSYILITSPDSFSSEIDPGVHKVPTGQESSNDCSSVPGLLSKEVKVGGSCETQSQWEQTVHVSISKELTKSWWWVPHDAKRVCSINTKKSIIKHTCSFRSSSSALLKKPCFAI